jgi:hypothetical protein
LGGEGQDQIDGFGVDCGGVGVADGLPLQVAEGYQPCFALCDVSHCIDLRLEVHLALEQLASAGHLGPCDEVVAVHLLEHGHLLSDCSPP